MACCKKPLRQNCDLVESLVHGEMTRIKQMDFGIGNVAAIGGRSGRREGRIASAPQNKGGWPARAQILLPARIGRGVGAIVVKQLALYCRLAGTRQSRLHPIDSATSVEDVPPR